MDFELEQELEPYLLQSAIRLGLQMAPKDRKTRLKDLSYHLGNLTKIIKHQTHASQEILSRSTISTQQSIDSLHSKVSLTRRFPTVSSAMVPAGDKIAHFGLIKEIAQDLEVVGIRG